MPRHVIVIAFTVVLLGSVAQQAQARTQTPAPAEKPASQNKPPSETPPPQGPPPQIVNVKVDLTITDQAGPGEPAKKTVTMIVADRSVIAIRSTANSGHGTINVDATPQILPNGHIRLQLGLEYKPRQGKAAADKVKTPAGDMVEFPGEPGGSSLNQRVTVVLEPNKPLILSQAADPLSDRKITVEVRVSVMK